MADFIDEVNAELRHERAMQFWKKTGGYFIAAALLVIAGTAGNVIWQNHQHSQSEIVTGRLLELNGKREAKQWGEVIPAYAMLAENNVKGMTALARLEQGFSLQESGKGEEAVSVYLALAEQKKTDKALANIARLRAVRILSASASKESFARIKTILQPMLEGEEAPFRPQAQELLAYAAMDAGEVAVARELLTAIKANLTAGELIRTRADAALAALPEIKKPS